MKQVVAGNETPKASEQAQSGDRPDFVTNEHLEYLDDLRESGVTNMFGARPYLIEEFSLDEKTAGKILSYWMQSFGKPNR